MVGCFLRHYSILPQSLRSFLSRQVFENQVNMSKGYKKISLQEDATDKMLPFIFDLPWSSMSVVQCQLGLEKMSKALSECLLMGIDTETKPVFARYRMNPTSLIQIALRSNSGVESVFIVDLLTLKSKKASMEFLDSMLCQRFRDHKCLKIGQGLSNDITELKRAYPQMVSFSEVNGVLETSTFLQTLQPEIKNAVSLKRLVKIFLNFNLVKSQQLSDWGRRPLAVDQLHYAACDALVLLRLYDAMAFEAQQMNADFSISSITKNITNQIEPSRKQKRKLFDNSLASSRAGQPFSVGGGDVSSVGSSRMTKRKGVHTIFDVDLTTLS